MFSHRQKTNFTLLNIAVPIVWLFTDGIFHDGGLHTSGNQILANRVAEELKGILLNANKQFGFSDDFLPFSTRTDPTRI